MSKNEIIESMLKVEQLDMSETLKQYLKGVARIPSLTPDETRTLAEKKSKGDALAKEKLIEANLKLVIPVAEYYRYIAMYYGISLLDLIQEGNVGLMKAAEKYNYKEKTYFKSYAWWWIRGAIIRVIEEKIKETKNDVNLCKKNEVYKNLFEYLEDKLNRALTIDEIAIESRQIIDEMSELYKDDNDTLSIDMLIQQGRESEFYSFIPYSDKQKVTLDDLYMKDDIETGVRKLLENSNLSDREIRILELKFGFNGREPLTCLEIAKEYGKSKQCINSILLRALDKLRKTKYINTFADYMQYPDEALNYINDLKQAQVEAKKRKSK